MKLRLHLGLLAVAAVAAGLGLTARAEDLTAFQLVKEGNRYVGEDARDQVVEIRSERAAGSRFPAVWYVVYYTKDAALRATEVKFKDGKKVDSKRAFRLLESMSADKNPLDRKKLNVDSDMALDIAARDPQLLNVKIKSCEMKLERSDDGPVWKIRLWAARNKNPDAEADVGEIWVLAGDGRVAKRDLHPDKVD